MLTLLMRAARIGRIICCSRQPLVGSQAEGWRVGSETIPQDVAAVLIGSGNLKEIEAGIWVCTEQCHEACQEGKGSAG